MFESSSCDCIPSRCGWSRDWNRDFPAGVQCAGALVPVACGRQLSAESIQIEDSEDSFETDFSDWNSGGDSEYGN